MARCKQFPNLVQRKLSLTLAQRFPNPWGSDTRFWGSEIQFEGVNLNVLGYANF